MVKIEERLPTPQEYANLRRAVGWPTPDPDRCARALAAGGPGVCAVLDDAVVGIGRLVGDGVPYWFVVDLIVEPTHQRSGIGARLVAALESIAARLSPGRAVSLVAAPEVIAFYERLSFEKTANVIMTKHRQDT